MDHLRFCSKISIQYTPPPPTHTHTHNNDNSNNNENNDDDDNNDDNNNKPAWSCQLACHGPLARYVILRAAHASGMPRTFSPSPRVSDPDKHHGKCVTHVSWCMPGSLTHLKSVAGKTFPASQAHAQFAILRIWLEVHDPPFSYPRRDGC